MQAEASEASFTTEILRWAKVYGFRCFHVRNSGHGGMTSVQGERGFPDLILLKPTRLIAAELKLEKKKPTADQLAWLEMFKAVGAEVYVWYNSQWSEILAVLSR